MTIPLSHQHWFCAPLLDAQPRYSINWYDRFHLAHTCLIISHRQTCRSCSGGRFEKGVEALVERLRRVVGIFRRDDVGAICPHFPISISSQINSKFVSLSKLPTLPQSKLSENPARFQSRPFIQFSRAAIPPPSKHRRPHINHTSRPNPERDRRSPLSKCSNCC